MEVTRKNPLAPIVDQRDNTSEPVGKRSRQEEKVGAVLTQQQEKYLESLSKIYADHPDLKGLVVRLEQVRQELLVNPERACVIEESSNVSRKMYVTRDEVHIVQKKAGEGSYSMVFFTVAMLFKDATIVNRVVKVSDEPFDKEVEILNGLSPASKTSNKIDHFIGSFYIPNLESNLAVFEPSDCDFTAIDYTKIILPVFFICKQLCNVLEGIASFHRQDIVLRDIKGANLLANIEGAGKVTDFGYLMKVKPEGEKHDATASVFYVAPYIWTSILGQKYWEYDESNPVSGGYQGKAVDVFAIGRVIQFDIFQEMIKQFGEQYSVPVAHFVDVQNAPRLIEGDYTDEELLEFDKAYPGRVFRDAANDVEDEDRLYIFEDRATALENTQQVINKFRGRLPKGEIRRMEQLAELAMQLQNPSKEGLQSFLGVNHENDQDLLIMAVFQKMKKIKCLAVPSLLFDPSSPSGEEVPSVVINHSIGEG